MQLIRSEMLKTTIRKENNLPMLVKGSVVGPGAPMRSKCTISGVNGKQFLAVNSYPTSWRFCYFTYLIYKFEFSLSNSISLIESRLQDGFARICVLCVDYRGAFVFFVLVVSAEVVYFIISTAGSNSAALGRQRIFVYV